MTKQEEEVVQRINALFTDPAKFAEFKKIANEAGINASLETDAQGTVWMRVSKMERTA